MRIDILTLFPEMFAPLNESILGRAQNKGVLQINTVYIRDFSLDKHLKCDDAPFGGGAGMVMTPQPVCDCIKSVDPEHKAHRIYMSPRGKLLTVPIAREYAQKYDWLVILCGHYEGIDQRIIDLYIDEEISIGDFVLTAANCPRWCFATWFRVSCRAYSAATRPAKTKVFRTACSNIRNILVRKRMKDCRFRTFCFPVITKILKSGGVKNRLK